MRLTIRGPRGFTAVLDEKGDYHVGRSGLTTSVSKLVELEETCQEIASGNDPMIGYDKISRDHLVININNDGVNLTDLGSSNGSYLKGKRFEDTEITKPGEYDLVLGRVYFKLKCER